MKETQEKIREYLEERNWADLAPGDLAKSISIEAAELLEVFQWDNSSLEDVKADQAKLAEVKQELADIFIYALDLAALLEVDTEQVISEKLEKVKQNYPAETIKTSDHKTYLRLKQEHRKTDA